VTETNFKLESSKVAQLLLKLQEDSQFLAEFNRDPDRIMIEAGISSQEDRNTLKSGNILRVHQLLAKEKEKVNLT
jgi:hypothetical protein